MAGKILKIPVGYIADYRASPRVGSAEADRRQVRMSYSWSKIRDGLGAAFQAVNGRASAFTLTEHDAVRVAAETEAWLDARGVPFKHRAGTEVRHSSGGPRAKRYKHSAPGTGFILRRNTVGHWILVEVYRTTVWPRTAAATFRIITEACRDAIVKKALEGAIIRTQEKPVFTTAELAAVMQNTRLHAGPVDV